MSQLRNAWRFYWVRRCRSAGNPAKFNRHRRKHPVSQGKVNNMKRFYALLALSALLFVLQAGATVTKGLPNTGTLFVPGVNYYGSGPQVYGGYTWTSTNAIYQGGSAYGDTDAYGFGANGYWDGSLGPMVGLNDSFDNWSVTDTMTFAFATPVHSVGGFFNYQPGGSTPTTLSVYDTSCNPIESYNLTFLTGGGVNTGEWILFTESTPIGYFTMSDNYVGVLATPEPGSLTLLGTGVIGLAEILRRKVWH